MREHLNNVYIASTQPHFFVIYNCFLVLFLFSPLVMCAIVCVRALQAYVRLVRAHAYEA